MTAHMTVQEGLLLASERESNALKAVETAIRKNRLSTDSAKRQMKDWQEAVLTLALFRGIQREGVWYILNGERDLGDYFP